MYAWKWILRVLNEREETIQLENGDMVNTRAASNNSEFVNSDKDPKEKQRTVS